MRILSFFLSIARYDWYNMQNIINMIPPSKSESRDDIMVPLSVLVAAIVGPVEEWFE